MSLPLRPNQKKRNLTMSNHPVITGPAPTPNPVSPTIHAGVIGPKFESSIAERGRRGLQSAREALEAFENFSVQCLADKTMNSDLRALTIYAAKGKAGER